MLTSNPCTIRCCVLLWSRLIPVFIRNQAIFYIKPTETSSTGDDRNTASELCSVTWYTLYTPASQTPPLSKYIRLSLNMKQTLPVTLSRDWQGLYIYGCSLSRDWRGLYIRIFFVFRGHSEIFILSFQVCIFDAALHAKLNILYKYCY